MKNFNYRPLFLLFAVSLHLILFWFLAGLKIFSTEAPEDSQQPQFMVVKISPPPPQPPPPTTDGTSSMSMPSPVVAPVPMVAAVMPISTSAPASFNVPVPKLPNLSDHFPTTGALAPGQGTGDGSGGSGRGNGDGQGNGDGLAGIGHGEHVIAVTDISTSMTAVTLQIWSQLAADYPNAYIVRSSSAYGKFIETEDKKPALKFSSAGDLYEGALYGLSQHPDATAIYFLTDFEDGGNDEATYIFVDILRKKHLKLYLCSVEQYPYDGLVQYAYESGGGFLQMTKKAITSFKPPTKVVTAPK